MFGDDHDIAVDYSNHDEVELHSRAELYTPKIRRSGIRNQVVLDILGYALWVSNSMTCRDNSDSQMMIKAPFGEIIDVTDVFQIDGGYKLELYLEEALKYGKNKAFTLANFVKPIRKKKNVSMDESEIEYNDMFSGKRSTIESAFDSHQRIFKLFAPTITRKTGHIKKISLQYKITWFLCNVRRSVLLWIFFQPHSIIQIPYSDKERN